MTTTDALPDPRGAALDLITQAVTTLEPIREDNDSDRRLRLLYAVCETWDKPCDSEDWESIIPRTHKRWNAVSDLLEYDKSRGLLGRIYRRVVQITDQAGDLVSSSNDDWPKPRDQQLARELRDAINDLSEVVYAITALHLLEEAAS